jgi:hypothetical protein
VGMVSSDLSRTLIAEQNPPRPVDDVHAERKQLRKLLKKVFVGRHRHLPSHLLRLDRTKTLGESRLPSRTRVRSRRCSRNAGNHRWRSSWRISYGRSAGNYCVWSARTSRSVAGANISRPRWKRNRHDLLYDNWLNQRLWHPRGCGNLSGIK